jgi:hypothetical protein
MASTGQAWMHLVQPMHSASRTSATCGGCARRAKVSPASVPRPQHFRPSASTPLAAGRHWTDAASEPRAKSCLRHKAGQTAYSALRARCVCGSQRLVACAARRRRASTVLAAHKSPRQQHTSSTPCGAGPLASGCRLRIREREAAERQRQDPEPRIPEFRVGASVATRAACGGHDWPGLT